MITSDYFTKVVKVPLECPFVRIPLPHFGLLARYTIGILWKMSEEMSEACCLGLQVWPLCLLQVEVRSHPRLLLPSEPIIVLLLVLRPTALFLCDLLL